MSGDEEFARRLREQADASVPVIPVETGFVLPRARRRRTVTRSVGALAALAVLGGAVWTAGALWPGRTTNPPAVLPAPETSVAPVSAERRVGLVGMWRVAADGEAADTFVRLSGSAQLQVWRDCGVIDGTWAVGPTRFVSEWYSWDGSCMTADGAPALPWLASAVGYRPDGDGWQLLDASGAVTATLRQDGLPQPDPNRVADEAQAPVADDVARSWLSDPAPLPQGLTAAAAGEVVGRWVPGGAPVAANPWVELAGDGTWQGSDGCNGGGGRWAIDVDGQLVITALGAMTDMACDGAALPELLTTARRLAIDDGRLVLVDHEGRTVATLTWDGPAATAPSPGTTSEPSSSPAATGSPVRTALPTASAAGAS